MTVKAVAIHRIQYAINKVAEPGDVLPSSISAEEVARLIKIGAARAVKVDTSIPAEAVAAPAVIETPKVASKRGRKKKAEAPAEPVNEEPNTLDVSDAAGEAADDANDEPLV